MAISKSANVLKYVLKYIEYILKFHQTRFDCSIETSIEITVNISQIDRFPILIPGYYFATMFRICQYLNFSSGLIRMQSKNRNNPTHRLLIQQIKQGIILWEFSVQVFTSQKVHIRVRECHTHANVPRAFFVESSEFNFPT